MFSGLWDHWCILDYSLLLWGATSKGSDTIINTPFLFNYHREKLMIGDKDSVEYSDHGLHSHGLVVLLFAISIWRGWVHFKSVILLCSPSVGKDWSDIWDIRWIRVMIKLLSIISIRGCIYGLHSHGWVIKLSPISIWRHWVSVKSVLLL